MQLFTYGYIKDQVESELDLQEETFIAETEMKRYATAAVRECEAEIHGINPGYFLTRRAIPLQSGVSEYALPDNIYASKIRSLMYDDENNLTYQLRQIRDFKEIPILRQSSGQDYMKFLLINEEDSGQKIKFYPTPQVTTNTALTCWYIRSAKILENESDVCDIPEFVNFIIKHMKVSCAKKEGHPLLGSFEADLEKEKELMLATLASMVVDEDNVMTMDTSLYEDMS